MHTKSCIFLSSGNFMPHPQSNRSAADTTTGSSQMFWFSGNVQENEHPESWWSCWLPSWCPLHSSPQGILSTLLTKEPNSQVKAACSSLLLLGVLKASPPTFAPGRLLDLAGGFMGDLCSCRWVFRWVWALGRCLSTVPLLPSHSQPSPLSPWDGRDPN